MTYRINSLLIILRILSITDKVVKYPNRADSLIGFNGVYTITLTADNVEGIISEVLQLVKNGLQLENISINPPSLEEVFLSVVNKNGYSKDREVDL